MPHRLHLVPSDVVRHIVRIAFRAIRPLGSPPEKQWCRVVMNKAVDRALTDLDPSGCSALEISGDLHAGRAWKRYESAWFPAFDLCTASVPEQTYDVVICEQVLEHVTDPWQATRSLLKLCRPGGQLIVSTPFLVRIHHEPEDYWRFTAKGLGILLEQAGFVVHVVETWGNRSCARANFRAWVPHRPWNSLRNDPEAPLVVWAFATRPQ